jgi:hypothetical protein
VELIGPYLVACFLLVAAGAVKVARPDGTARALAGLPANRLPVRWVARLVRVGAALELALGLAALALPRPPLAWLVAASYAAFAATVAYVRSTGGALASCGCFGTPDTPATGLHLVVDLVLCASAAMVALAHPAGSLPAVLAHQPAGGAPLLAASAMAAWLAYLAVSRLADLQAARALTAISFERDR